MPAKKKPATPAPKPAAKAKPAAKPTATAAKAAPAKVPPAKPASAKTTAKIAKPSAKSSGEAAVKSALNRAVAVDASERQRRIAEAAYFLAEKRGFDPAYVLDDWLQAERTVNAQLGA